MTVYDTTLAEVLTRLQGSPALIANGNVRRAHLTDVPIEDSPAIRILDGRDKPAEGNCFDEHEAEFTVRIILRGDTDTVSRDAWDLADDILGRLNPNADAYTSGAQIRLPTITPDREVADQDQYALDMVFPMTYRSTTWSLS